MRFEDSFKIWINREDTITLKQALKIAEDESISDFIYDPLGFHNKESWWWCAGVLEVLQQEDWIREFDVIKEAPKSQRVESKAGVIY